MTLLNDLRSAAEPLDRRGTVPQPRLNAAPVTPSARMAELTARLESQRRLLGEAASAIERLERNAEEQREDRYHRFGGVSFGGLPAAQHWCDLILWEAVLNEHYDVLGSITEIGTWKGGFSLWLHAQAQVRGLSFTTYDAVPPTDERGVLLKIPGFERRDVWENPGAIIKSLHASEPCILFCDGGNKPRELKTFGTKISPGSLVAVHDWGTEMPPDAVPDELEMVYGEYAEELGGITRFFRLRQTGEVTNVKNEFFIAPHEEGL